VPDLVQQPERDDLTGAHRRRARGPLGVHPVGESSDGGQVRRHQVAAAAEEGAVDAVALPSLASHVEVGHRRSLARSVARVRSSRGAPGRDGG
jgi:hypothetical protein